MIKSSRVLKYMGQYGFLAGAIGWISGSVFHFIQGFASGDWDHDEMIIPLIVGLFHLVGFLYARNKFVVVELSGQTIRIYNDKETIDTTWLNVESIDKLPFSSPPIYTLRLKDMKGFFIFWNSAISFLWFDDSELGEIISKKKKDLDI